MLTQQRPMAGKRRKLGVGVFVAVLAGLPVLAYFQVDQPWIIMGLTFFYIVTAFVLQSRLVSATLGGVFLGFLSAPQLYGNIRIEQLWESIAWQLMGVLIGLVFGVVWDYRASVADRDEELQQADASKA